MALPLLLRGGTNGGMAVLGGEGEREYARRCFGVGTAAAVFEGGASESESEEEESDEDSEEDDEDDDEEEEELDDDAMKNDQFRFTPRHRKQHLQLTALALCPLHHRLLDCLFLPRITIVTTTIIGRRRIPRRLLLTVFTRSSSSLPGFSF